MITRKEFAKIDSEIKTSLKTTLESIKINSPENYILLLADAEYFKDFDIKDNRISPYIIDNRIDKLRDSTRLKFLSEFLNSYYTFPSHQRSTDDNENRINLELMIYTHIWEANSFLKKLYRLTQIVNGENYNWKVKIPDMKKSDFIRTKIKEPLEKISNPISKIIKNGYHSSLRNAFAHSEYSIDFENKKNRIALYNYKAAEWELREITFNDWSERFVYSAIFTFHFFNIIHESRLSIIEDFTTDVFTINHPTTNGKMNRVQIKYDLNTNSFHFIQKYSR